MAAFKLRVNGVLMATEVDAQMPLLWVLREVLNLTGTKYGCGRGLCGACTVQIDGRPVRSCITPVNTVMDRDITTIEGLKRSEVGRRVQAAWIEEDVPQCGYCQGGQLLTAAALLADTPNPKDAEIDNALSGNLCRCGTYDRIRKAIHRAAAATP